MSRTLVLDGPAGCAWPSSRPAPCARVRSACGPPTRVFALDPDPARRELAAGLGASHDLDPAAEPQVGLQIRERNQGQGVDVAIESPGRTGASRAP